MYFEEHSSNIKLLADPFNKQGWDFGKTLEI